MLSSPPFTILPANNGPLEHPHSQVNSAISSRDEYPAPTTQPCAFPLCVSFCTVGCHRDTFPCSWPNGEVSCSPNGVITLLLMHCVNKRAGRALNWPIQRKALPTQSVNTWAHHRAGPVLGTAAMYSVSAITAWLQLLHGEVSSHKTIDPCKPRQLLQGYISRWFNLSQDSFRPLFQC